MPYITRCKYCTVPYTVISKLETMEQDLHYISQMVGVELQQGEVENTSSSGSTADLAREYLRALDREVVDQLYQFYTVDFDMFGYSVESFVAN
jgi:chondroitin 4-sulfotransferase 11